MDEERNEGGVSVTISSAVSASGRSVNDHERYGERRRNGERRGGNVISVSTLWSLATNTNMRL